MYSVPSVRLLKLTIKKKIILLGSLMDKFLN